MAKTAEHQTNEELAAALQAAGRDTPEAASIMEELWSRNIKLIRYTVHKWTGLNAGEDGFEDMEQQAYFGFHAAAYTYDSASGANFATYAVLRIRWELSRYFENNGYTVRIPAYMQQRLRKAAEKRRELTAETGRAVSFEAALQALGLSPAAVAGTLSVMNRLETASLDAETYSDEGDGLSLLARLDSGADVEEDVIGWVWHQELHELLFKALQDVPERARGVILRRFFVGVPWAKLEREYGATRQTMWEWENDAFRAIRTGEYGGELAEFCPTESAKAKAERTIQRERAALERLRLTDEERGLLAL